MTCKRYRWNVPILKQCKQNWTFVHIDYQKINKCSYQFNLLLHTVPSEWTTEAGGEINCCWMGMMIRMMVIVSVLCCQYIFRSTMSFRKARRILCSSNIDSPFSIHSPEMASKQNQSTSQMCKMRAGIAYRIQIYTYSCKLWRGIDPDLVYIFNPRKHSHSTFFEEVLKSLTHHFDFW